MKNKTIIILFIFSTLYFLNLYHTVFGNDTPKLNLKTVNLIYERSIFWSEFLKLLEKNSNDLAIKFISPQIDGLLPYEQPKIYNPLFFRFDFENKMDVYSSCCIDKIRIGYFGSENILKNHGEYLGLPFANKIQKFYLVDPNISLKVQAINFMPKHNKRYKKDNLFYELYYFDFSVLFKRLENENIVKQKLSSIVKRYKNNQRLQTTISENGNSESVAFLSKITFKDQTPISFKSKLEKNIFLNTMKMLIDAEIFTIKSFRTFDQKKLDTSNPYTIIPIRIETKTSFKNLFKFAKLMQQSKYLWYIGTFGIYDEDIMEKAEDIYKNKKVFDDASCTILIEFVVDLPK